MRTPTTSGIQHTILAVMMSVGRCENVDVASYLSFVTVQRLAEPSVILLFLVALYLLSCLLESAINQHQKPSCGYTSVASKCNCETKVARHSAHTPRRAMQIPSAFRLVFVSRDPKVLSLQHHRVNIGTHPQTAPMKAIDTHPQTAPMKAMMVLYFP